MANFPKEFTIKCDVKNVRESTGKLTVGPEETFFNVPWQLYFRKEAKPSVFVKCVKPGHSTLWSIRAECAFVFKSATTEIKLESFTYTFNADKRTCGVTNAKQNLEAFTAEETVTISCHVKIQNMVGIPQKRKLVFETPNGKMTDVALKVGEKKFHISKALLANFSPVFRAMFFGEFAESEASEIPIDETDANEFEVFLNFIYSGDADITEWNTEGLLILAHKYDTDVVAAKCEKFLMASNKMEMVEKFHLAEKYTLTGLQNHCLAKFKTAKDLKNLNVGVDDMGEKTAKALYLKAMSFL